MGDPANRTDIVATIRSKTGLDVRPAERSLRRLPKLSGSEPLPLERKTAALRTSGARSLSC